MSRFGHENPSVLGGTASSTSHRSVRALRRIDPGRLRSGDLEKESAQGVMRRLEAEADVVIVSIRPVARGNERRLRL